MESKRKRLPDVDSYLEAIAPTGKRTRISYDVSVRSLFRVYRGTSFAGPCVFYHHPSTDTWVLVCRNRNRRINRLKPILTHATAAEPLVCSSVRNLLDNPTPVYIPANHASPHFVVLNMLIPDFENVGSNLHSSWNNILFAMQRERPDHTAAAKYMPLEPTCSDGDLVWAVWQTASELRRLVRTRLPEGPAEKIFEMVGDMPCAGFTGFYATRLLIEDGGKFIKCRNNPCFWAKRMEGPVHYWEEEADAEFALPPLPPPPAPSIPFSRRAEEEVVTSDEDEDAEDPGGH